MDYKELMKLFGINNLRWYQRFALKIVCGASLLKEKLLRNIF